jgi:hypothetical protein
MPQETVGTNTTHVAPVMQRIWMISVLLISNEGDKKRKCALKGIKEKEDNSLVKNIYISIKFAFIELIDTGIGKIETSNFSNTCRNKSFYLLSQHVSTDS